MQKFKRMFGLLLSCVCVCFMCFYSRSLDVSAEVVKKTAADMRSFYGDSLNVEYEYDGVPYSSSASYYGTISRFSSGRESIASGSIISSISALSDYDIILYQLSVPSTSTMYLDVVISGFYTRFDGYARGGFVGSLDGLGWSLSVSDSQNSVSYWPNNFLVTDSGNISAVLSASSSDYYGFFGCSVDPNYNFNVSCRMLQYEFLDGGVIETVHFDGLKSDAFGHIFIGVICPYVEGSISSSPPVTATTASGSQLGSYDINVTVDVDFSPVVSEISGVAGEVQRVKDEVTGIATDVSNIGSLLAVDASETAANMSLEPLGTLSSIDYDQILDDADEVMEDLPNALVGTASLWSMISALVDTNAIWLWLIPLCMFLCFLSVMLWRS